MTEQSQERRGPTRRPEPTQSDDSALAQRVADLELQLAQRTAGTPLGTTPNHGAGVGGEFAETWSQYDQTLANAGEHPDQQEE